MVVISASAIANYILVCRPWISVSNCYIQKWVGSIFVYHFVIQLLLLSLTFIGACYTHYNDRVCYITSIAVFGFFFFFFGLSLWNMRFFPCQASTFFCQASSGVCVMGDLMKLVSQYLSSRLLFCFTLFFGNFLAFWTRSLSFSTCKLCSKLSHFILSQLLCYSVSLILTVLQRVAEVVLAPRDRVAL